MSAAGHEQDFTERAYRALVQQAKQRYEFLPFDRAATAGHGVLRATGFVAVSASDSDELERAVAAIEQAAIQASCETRRLWGQQA